MMDIKGYYTFKIPLTTMFMNHTLEINGENLITFLGETFFINRCLNDEYKPLKYICLGNSSVAPTKTDIKLNHELVRKKASARAESNNNSILLTQSFTGDEVVGVNEIGVTAVNNKGEDVLVSHDVFSEIDGAFLTNLIGTVEVEYRFQFVTSNIIEKSYWTKYNDPSGNIYYTYQPNAVSNVYASNGNGFHLKKNFNDIRSTKGSYYYNVNNQNLYINLHENTTINDVEIIVQLKGGIYE